MKAIKNILIPGSANRMMATDIFYTESSTGKPVVIYAHGFNGFKDWGNFDLIAEQFAMAGFVFVKFNFSHNGTTPEQPEDFADLEAFGENNYTKELDDLGYVIDWVSDKSNPHKQVIDSKSVYLVGHSLGGGIAILKAAEDSRITKLVTWASVSECKTPWGNWPEAIMKEWERSGVQYYVNSRTHQNMPLHYQLYQDYIQHADRLSIQKAISHLQIPILICHGTQDSSVPVQQAFRLKEWQPNAQLFLVESDHVFGRKHPWYVNKLADSMQQAVTESIRLLKRA